MKLSRNFGGKFLTDEKKSYGECGIIINLGLFNVTDLYWYNIANSIPYILYKFLSVFNREIRTSIFDPFVEI